MLSPRFGDIFRGNAGKQGLLAAVVEQDDVERLWAVLEGAPGTEVTVDLEARTAAAGDVVVPFEVDDYTRWRLMEGLDDIGLTLRHVAEIAAYEARRPSWLPATLPVPAPSLSEGAAPPPATARATGVGPTRDHPHGLTAGAAYGRHGRPPVSSGDAEAA